MQVVCLLGQDDRLLTDGHVLAAAYRKRFVSILVDDAAPLQELEFANARLKLLLTGEANFSAQHAREVWVIDFKANSSTIASSLQVRVNKHTGSRVGVLTLPNDRLVARCQDRMWATAHQGLRRTRRRAEGKRNRGDFKCCCQLVPVHTR